MEKTKLTLRIEQPVIAAAKAYAQEHNTTLSKLVEEFLYSLTAVDDTQTPPILRELTGVLPADVSLAEHQEYLTEKYAL